MFHCKYTVAFHCVRILSGVFHFTFSRMKGFIDFNSQLKYKPHPNTLTEWKILSHRYVSINLFGSGDMRCNPNETFEVFNVI
jgi:hypothetical protein